MTKRITSLFLVLALCLTFFPVMASAEGEDEVGTGAQSWGDLADTSWYIGHETDTEYHITTAEQLAGLAKLVNEIPEDSKDAEDVEASEDTEDVEESKTMNFAGKTFYLDNDLDLSGHEWIPIAGKTTYEDDYGFETTTFSATFYGNGHVISGLDFSEVYRQQYVTGLFGTLKKAKIYDLTVNGTFDIAIDDGEYRYFGSIAGLSENSLISNCISNVTFKNNDNFVYGTFGLTGYAIDTTVEYCRNVADITITGDMGSLYVGGIVGFAESNKGISKISYCSNTGDMTLAAPHGGGIVGQLGGKSQVSNCYSSGKLIPIGNTEIGGIAGTVGSSATVNHCYYFGDIDLSKFTDDNSKLYSRFGGIVGYSSNSAIYQNNYYTDTENVTACGVGIDASTVGIAKQSGDMKIPDFYDTLKKGGGDYVYVENSTPILPAPKYAVTFEVTPDNLGDNVTVKIDGVALDLTKKTMELAAGTHTVTVERTTFSKEITITADRATHTKTLDLTADYSKVDVALAKVPADLTGYTSSSVATLNEAIAAVGGRDKNVTQQDEVNAMAQVIENAITGLVRKSSGSSSSGSGNTTTKTETTTNPDGSTTKTETKKDGSVTETTTGTDGSVTKTETKTDTKSDGSKTETKTETKTDADGNKTTSKTETTTDKSGTVTESKTETKTDADGTKTEVKSETKKDQNGVTTGTETVKETLPNGSTGTTTTTTDASGAKTEAETTISSKAVDEAKKNDTAVTVPVEVKATEDSQTAPTIKVELPKNSGETKVEIPVSNVTPGTVVAIVKPDGTEEIVKDCIPTENGIQLAVEDNVTLKVFDNAKDFTDTKGHWAEPYIDFASARELLNGISEDTFAPEQPTTRAMMWTVLARQDDTDLSGGTTWYDKAQAWAKDSGVSDGTAPQANVTRAQMVTMLWRAAGSPAPQTMSSFADVSADAYYAAAVAWAAEQGITNGVSATQFQPNGACTRAQIAAFLYRASLEN